MGLQKTIEFRCDGPCKRQGMGSDLPHTWSKLVLKDAKVIKGRKLRYCLALMCPDCSCKLADLLTKNGFNLISVNEEKS